MAACIPTFCGSFTDNLRSMVDLLSRGEKAHTARGIGFELERILIDSEGKSVPFEGSRGVSALLHALGEMHPQEELTYIDGHLLGLSFEVTTPSGKVAAALSLEPAAQLEVSVGPTQSVLALMQALEAVDTQIKQAMAEIGLHAQLCARGYNPTIDNPCQLPLIPKTRYAYMDAYLSQRGRFARDMMRASASTQVSLDYECEADCQRIYRMATYLGPLFAFLFDNAPRFRGKDAPCMVRSRIWHHVDVDRCGIVPGSLEGLSFEDYILWVSNIKPILFTDAQHITTHTGELYARDIMSKRELSTSELSHLLSMVFPNVRLKGFVELREMDSLPPRLACACTSFVEALLYDAKLEEKLVARLDTWIPQGFDTMDENDCVAARLHLEEKGWDAEIYGVSTSRFTEALSAIALENSASQTACKESCGTTMCSDPEALAFDHEGIELLAHMWSARRLPRDLAQDA